MRLDKSLIDVGEFLEALGVTVVKTVGDEVSFECPFGSHRAGGSATMQQGTTLFYCFGCGAKGDAVTFFSKLEGVPPWRAQRWLAERWTKGFREPQGSFLSELMGYLGRKVGVTQESAQELPEELLGRFLVDWHMVASAGTSAPEELRYILDRGFTPEALEEWEIGFDATTSRVVLTVRDELERLVGFKGRLTRDVNLPKYIVLGGSRYGFPTYEIGGVVYGLGRARRLGHKKLVICEGELNAIALSDAGVEGAVALAHSHATPKQLRLIKDWADSVVLFLDNDDAGRVGTKELELALHPTMKVTAVEADRDPADMAPQERVEAVKSAVSLMLKSFV